MKPAIEDTLDSGLPRAYTPELFNQKCAAVFEHVYERYEVRKQPGYTKLVYTADVKNITLTADEALIEAARARAQLEDTTLNEQFRIWLAGYAHPRERLQRYDEAMKQLRGKVKMGRKLSREEMNER